jgi:hypothetical protein
MSMKTRDDHVARSISLPEYINQSLTYPHQHEGPHHHLNNPQQ